jgi:hypothetical protein
MHFAPIYLSIYLFLDKSDDIRVSAKILSNKLKFNNNFKCYKIFYVKNKKFLFTISAGPCSGRSIEKSSRMGKKASSWIWFF